MKIFKDNVEVYLIFLNFFFSYSIENTLNRSNKCLRHRMKNSSFGKSIQTTLNKTFNDLWAEVILEALTRHHVRHVCIAPGSRSTPLTLSATTNKKFTCHTHFDERGLGYLALGLAKASNEPVAVIVTSGTAVANLYPALVEAGLTGEKLILLTADRPPELIDCGANQAIRQTGMFANHASQTINLPRPTPDIQSKWLVSIIDQGMNNLQQGALHVNCPFAEPLYGGNIENLEWQAHLGTWWQSSTPWLSEEQQEIVPIVNDWSLWRQKKGVIIAGRMTAEEGSYLADWAEKLGWPLISDTLSQTGQPFPYADLWLNVPEIQATLSKTQLVIQFGACLTGKRLLHWREVCDPEEYWLVDPIEGRLDPTNHRGRKLTCQVGQWLSEHPAECYEPWAKCLPKWVDKVRSLIQRTFKDQFTEASTLHKLDQLLPSNGQLFIGNSLCIRLIDAFCQLPKGYPVYSNRGASGIDGLIATMAGVQRITNKQTIGVIGDLATLHDLNSLALLRSPSASIVLIISNNNGGRIFSIFSIPEPLRENYYCMPQHVNFKHAAAMFNLQYATPKTWQQLMQTLEQFWKLPPQTLIVELNFENGDGTKIFLQLVKQMTQLKD